MRSATLWISLATVLVGPLTAQGQPTALTVKHQAGQTFLTWKENSAIAGESYRIYRHTAQITAANFGSATRIFEVTEESGRFTSDRYDTNPLLGPFDTRYLKHFVHTRLGPQLAPGTGMLVWTLDPLDFGGLTGGNGFYAVTTVNAAGTENTTTFNTGNSSPAVFEKVATPEPVLALQDSTQRASVFLQYMDLRRWNATLDAPNNLNRFYGLGSSTPGAPQYGYTYTVLEPAGTANDLALVIDLHPFLGGEPRPMIPLPATSPAILVYPHDPGNTWWFGFEENTDYRTSAPTSGRIVNFTEHRLLRMIRAILDDSRIGNRIDQDRIYVRGYSMGASGTLSMAMRYPEIFAAAYADKPASKYDTMPTQFIAQEEGIWGTRALNLPVHIMPLGSWGCDLQDEANTLGVWGWQDHHAGLTTRRRDEVCPIGITHGQLDPLIPLATQGTPLYAAFENSDRCYGVEVFGVGHGSNYVVGMPPTMANTNFLVHFANYQVRRDETVPGMSAASSNTAQLFNQSVEWRASWTTGWGNPPTDTPNTWQMDFRIPSGPNVTVDITPRRAQHFHTTPGAVYNTTITDLATMTTTTGQVTGDAAGLITVPISVATGGTRLNIQRAAPYTLTIPQLVYPGTYTATASGSQPNSLALMILSISGRDVIDIPGFTQINLCNHAVHSAVVADGAGDANFAIALHASQVGGEFWFQTLGYDANGAIRSSNVVQQTIQ